MLEALCPRVQSAIFPMYGYRVDLDLSDHIQRKMFLNFDWEDLNHLRNRLKPGMVAVDIGCNVGAYTLLASSLVGSKGKVYAFEPNPQTHKRLKNTIAANKITNIALFNCGLSDSPGQLTLYPNTEPNNASATMVADGQTKGITVPVSTLDQVVDDNQIQRIDYLKMDVDGFEPNVLKGARQSLSRRIIRFLQTEFSDHWLSRNGSNPQKLYAEIVDHGFHDVEGTAIFRSGDLKDRFFELSQK